MQDQSDPLELTQANGRIVVTVRGANGSDQAAEVLGLLGVFEHPEVTVDLREAPISSHGLVHALLRAWDHRGRVPGSVRVLATAGPVEQYLVELGLHHILDLVCDGREQERQPTARGALVVAQRWVTRALAPHA